MESLQQYNKIFFIGVAGTGMSALAQYCKGIGKHVSGSDRYFGNSTNNEIQQQLTQFGIQCFAQDASGIDASIDVVVISTAVEDTNIEVQKAKALGITILKRSQLLTLISKTKKTIAIGGTSGKSTTTAILFDILEVAGLQPSIISGAGLVRLQEKGLIGNAWVGNGDWLVIEADESDGSIVYYEPQIGVLLNIDKDHKEIEELYEIFNLFKSNSKQFVVNQSNEHAAKFSLNKHNDFGVELSNVGYSATAIKPNGFEVNFRINETAFSINTFGVHNVENALAASAVASLCGVNLNTSAKAIKAYKGIYRRNQILGTKHTVLVIDDYAHNPAKCAAAIKGVQAVSKNVVAWFQPHGYGPTRFLRNDFVHELATVLRPSDTIIMSEIFYAGGTAVKDISANDLIQDLKTKGCNAIFIEDRKNLTKNIKHLLQNNSVLLLMGARDPSLAQFAQNVFDEL